MPTCPSCNRTVSSGTTICRSCGASIPEFATLTGNLEREVRSLLDQGKKIEAVKVYREHTDSSLKDAKDAKDAVEALQRGASLPPSTEANADLEAEVLRILEQGEKIKAVKLYKDRTGVALFDAKREVEEIAARHGIIVEQAGCSGVLVLSIVVLIAIAVVAAMMIVRK